MKNRAVASHLNTTDLWTLRPGHVNLHGPCLPLRHPLVKSREEHGLVMLHDMGHAR